MLSPARAIVLVAVLSVVPLVSTIASAQDAGPPATADGIVDLALVGPEDSELKDSIRELLARLHVAVAAPGAPSGGSSSRVASVQIDLSSRTDALIVVTDAATGEVRLRRSVPRDASAAITREEIAHAVQSAVEAALVAARDRASQPPPPAPPPPPPSVIVVAPAPPPVKEEPKPIPPPSRFGLEVATLAGVGPIANDSGAGTRIGLGVVAVSRAFLRPSLALSFLYAVPFDNAVQFDNGNQDLSTQTTIVSTRALAGIGLVRGAWFAADLGVGGGFDDITVAPRSNQLSVNDQTTRIDALLSAMLTAHVGLTAGVVLLVSAGVDVDLDSRRYVYAQGSTDTPLLAPWNVRPMILAGFGFTALGDGYFPTSGGH
ncbi:MAG: hypothetical protein ACLQVI_43975 [Polyangiaceae bacterium]